MHLLNSKSCLFYIPGQSKFVSSAWATFPKLSSLIKTLVHPATPTASKGAINFLLNKLTLGDFSAEHMVEAQDLASNCVANKLLRPPKSYAEAMKQPDSMAWQQAISQEIENMKNHAVFEMRPLPANTKPIGGGWVFVKKPASKTCDARYQARYIAWVNSQLSGYDFHENFAPTATFTSLSLLLPVAVHLEWHTSSFDFISTYLNMQIDKELWIRPPEGIVWHTAGRDAQGFHLSQVRLIQSILTNNWDQKADYDSPLPVKCNLLTLQEQDKTIQQHDFISAVGALSYVVTGTQPDLAYAVNLLARYSMRPGANHWHCLQHVLGYLNKTHHYCLSLTPDPGKLELTVYSDASWGSEFLRSSHRYITTFLGFPIAWCAKQLSTIASSSCHAEFMALETEARHVQWLQHLLLEVLSLKCTIQLRCDNASCIKISTDCSSNKCTWHSDRDSFFTKKLLYNGSASIHWIPSCEMLADGFTKPLGPLLHNKLFQQIFSTPFS
ncbi:hypothetical protein O181_056136 [Austropuccinia psidii MF-1]|uniref:Reverse transcriptase Ty1/copia-type domain-containing protein n=1 Tax=Austropuccinia psidii MF-1 TaxID=1389203 RepID=A0A9Q3E5R9_9BASI|nr:hypothetical protein [Austropuccinia psidii MF-1]